MSRGAVAEVIRLALIPLTACGSEAAAPPPGNAPAGGGDAPTAAPAAGGGASGPVASGAPAKNPSRCSVTPDKVSCSHNVSVLDAGVAVRAVYWQTPSSPPPPGGYPVVVVYQGSFSGPHLSWADLGPNAPFGGYHQGRLHAMLLDGGFTVVAPEAAAGVAWQTNSGVPYEATADKAVVEALLAAIGQGAYGPADLGRLYATGISSGGYMTSRMAVSHAGRFRALAVHSASYATCSGSICSVPALPADHPPTLILHGQKDSIAPLSAAELYYDALVKGSFEVKKIVDPQASHEWLATSPEAITAWFTTH